MLNETLRKAIRTVPDWPRDGVQFRDITPLLHDPQAFHALVGLLAQRYRAAPPDYIAGIDARGFILGAALAYELARGFIPVRKQGKLPFTTLSEDYALEYGSATVEIHTDACRRGDRVLLVDDLIATGGTLLAAARLFRRLGAEVIEAAVVVDLPELGSAQRVRSAGIPIYAVCDFAGP